MHLNKKRFIGSIVLATTILLFPLQSLAAKSSFVSLSYENGTTPGIYQVVPNTNKATLIKKDNTYRLVETNKPLVKLEDAEDMTNYKLGKVTTQKEAINNFYSDSYTQFINPVDLGEDLIFQSFLGESLYGSSCGGGSVSYTHLYKRDAKGKETLLTNDLIANASGTAVQVKDKSIYYTKLNAKAFNGYTLYRIDANGKNKVEIAKDLDDYILSETNEIFYLKDYKLFKMDLNGKKSVQIKAFPEELYGMSGCNPAGYKLTASGIYFDNTEDFQTKVYDFSLGKVITIENQTFYNFIDHSKKLDQFAIIQYDYTQDPPDKPIGVSIIDKKGNVLKDIKLPADTKNVKVDIDTGILSYFVKSSYIEKKY